MAMPLFAANLTMLFTEVPFMERFALAEAAGFRFVEYLFPYEYPQAELKARLDRHGLRQVLFNLPAGDWGRGDRGIAADPGRIAEFRAGVAQAVTYARALGVLNLNCLAGKRIAGAEDRQRETLVANLRFAARLLGEHGLRLLVEQINHFDIPGFLLNRTGQVLALLDEVGEPNTFLQFDMYHAQREEGELAATLRNQLHRIAHIQVADNPGRHQPGTGEINHPFLFAEMDRLGYPGYVGLEYVPSPDTQSSFGWMQALAGSH
jgi:hydroxypyruvate isomerase